MLTVPLIQGIVVMPQQPSQLGQWFRRNWFLALVISFALALGLIQFWLQWEFRPRLVVTGIITAVSVAVLLGFVLAVLRLRQPLADMRYRWLTREVDRAVRGAERVAKRPV
jgi:small basic protein